MPRFSLEPQMPQQRLAIRSHMDGLVITEDLLAAPWRSPDVGHCLEAVSVMVLERDLFEGEAEGIIEALRRPELQNANISGLLELSVPVTVIGRAAASKPSLAPRN